MYLTTFFTDNGTPQTWLTPTITVYDLKNNELLVDNQTCLEVWSGFYKYLVNFDVDNKEITAIFDGGATLGGAERYSYLWNDNRLKLEEIAHYSKSASRHSKDLTMQNNFNNFKKDIEKELKVLTDFKKDISKLIKAIKIPKQEIIEIEKPIIIEKLKEIDFDWLKKTFKQDIDKNGLNLMKLIVKQLVKEKRNKIKW